MFEALDLASKKVITDENVARDYLEARRWKGEPICPTCSSRERIQIRKVAGYYRCLSCASDFTVRTGTIFERSHMSLEKWLQAIYLISVADKRITSVQLSKAIGCTQKTAWTMLQKLNQIIKTNSNNLS